MRPLFHRLISSPAIKRFAVLIKQCPNTLNHRRKHAACDVFCAEVGFAERLSEAYIGCHHQPARAKQLAYHLIIFRKPLPVPLRAPQACHRVACPVLGYHAAEYRGHNAQAGYEPEKSVIYVKPVFNALISPEKTAGSSILCPTMYRSPIGSGQSLEGISSGHRVCTLSGFSNSQAILARSLFVDIPILTVKPSSFFILSFIMCAVAKGSPKYFSIPVQFRNASSIENFCISGEFS